MTLDELAARADILLVEDNYGDVLLTREACEGQSDSIRLSVAWDGEEAVAILRGLHPAFASYRPDIVLLDINLPRLDGHQLLTIIKSDPELKRIPVIMMTSSNAEIDVLKSYDLRANSYIVKPVEFGRLQEVIASLDLFWRRTATLPSSARVTGDDS